jgi:hypothetical protein
MKRWPAAPMFCVSIAAAIALSLASCKPVNPPSSQIERGAYLVMVGGCNDCHTPKVMTDKGPVPDTTRLLSGHHGGSMMPPIPAGLIGPTAWGAVTNNDLTAWAGPWGVSFSYNLTPDNATGLGAWDENTFIQTLRSGKFMSMSRDILPPMPWQEIGQMKDEDLKAIFAYLKSIPAINNPIPTPLPPTDMSPASKGK